MAKNILRGGWGGGGLLDGTLIGGGGILESLGYVFVKIHIFF